MVTMVYVDLACHATGVVDLFIRLFVYSLMRRLPFRINASTAHYSALKTIANGTIYPSLRVSAVKDNWSGAN